MGYFQFRGEEPEIRSCRFLPFTECVRPGIIRYLLFAADTDTPDTHPGVLVDAEEKTGQDADRKKQP